MRGAHPAVTMKAIGRLARGALCAVAVLVWGGPATAQQTDFGLIDGSVVFLDEDGDSRCAAVNTFNADFFIRSCDRRLILITGDDRETPYFVDADYNVSAQDGSAAGRIRFATDNDGFRQVFWLSDEGFPEGPNLVLNYVSETDELVVATIAGQDGQQVPLEPINVRETQCDPLATFDGGDELLCPRTCGTGGAGASLMMVLMFGLVRLGTDKKAMGLERTLCRTIGRAER